MHHCHLIPCLGMSLPVNRVMLLRPHEELGQLRPRLAGWSICRPCNQDTAASTAQKKLLILLLERLTKLTKQGNLGKWLQDHAVRSQGGEGISSPPEEYQRAANVHEIRLATHVERGNTCVKLAANNTGIQQDLNMVKTGFKALKHNMRTLSRRTIQPNIASQSLENSLRRAKMKYGLNLVGSAKTTLVEGVKRMPPALRASFPKKDLVAAAVMTGRIDSKYNQFPNGKVIIEGVKCDVKEEEWKKIESTFTRYHLETTGRGMISEKSYDDDGFIRDKASCSSQGVHTGTIVRAFRTLSPLTLDHQFPAAPVVWR